MATAWSQMGREEIAIIQRGSRLIAGLERFEWGRDRRRYNGARGDSDEMDRSFDDESWQ